MIIGIDGNEANLKNRVGVGQYAFNLLKNLHSLDPKNKYIIYLKNPPLIDLPKANKNWQYRVFGPQKLWTKIALPFHLFFQKEKLSLFFSPSHYSPQFSPFPTVPTIHDLGYFQYQNQFTKKDLYQLINWTKDSLKKASKIITVSEFSKNEIKKIYKINPNKITIAYNGVDSPSPINPKIEKETLDFFNIKSKKYYLYLGTLKPNKNIPFLIESFAKYFKIHQTVSRPVKGGFVPKLVIAGKKGWLFSEIFDCVKKEKMENSVIFTDFINESQKWVLYKNAKALIMPSFYEGFGIPIIEAMKVNTPVISSDIPPLKEVAQDNAIYFNPLKQQELIDQLINFEKLNKLDIQKITKKAKIRADKFSWVNTAKSVLSVFNKFDQNC